MKSEKLPFLACASLFVLVILLNFAPMGFNAQVAILQYLAVAFLGCSLWGAVTAFALWRSKQKTVWMWLNILPVVFVLIIAGGFLLP